jgi:hypothetical protein
VPGTVAGVDEPEAPELPERADDPDGELVTVDGTAIGEP